MRARTVFVAAIGLAALALPLTAAAAKPQPGGAIVFTSVRANEGRELYVVNRDGSGLRRLTYNSLFERQAAWSPDRTQIAFSAADQSGNFDLYVIGTDGNGQHRITTDGGRDDSPQWTASGRIVYQHNDRAWIVNSDGSSPTELPTGPGDALTPTASPQGNKIAFASNRGGTVDAIYVMQENGNGLRQVTHPTAGMDVQPRFSPTGNELAFMRDNGTADNDLYVVGIGGNGLRQLTNTPNRIEFWSSWSGDDIIFSAPDVGGKWHLYSVPSAGGPETTVSTIPQAPYTDSFDHGVVDSSFWYTLQDPGSTIGVANGELVASIAGTAVPGGQYDQVNASIGSPCHVPGDFDMQLDYRLLTWPAHGGFFAGLQSIFADVAVARISAPWDPPYNQSYNGWSNSSNGFQFAGVNTLDMSGQLRIARVSDTVYAYERSGNDPWNLFFTANGNTGEGIPQLGLFAQGNTFGHEDGSVAYDNFRLNSGAVTCPSWWQDFAPDAG
jgi:hypothetical protein